MKGKYTEIKKVSKKVTGFDREEEVIYNIGASDVSTTDLLI